MKTITVPREIEFSDKIPGMTKIEVELFTVCELQKLTIEGLTPFALKGKYDDEQYLTDVLFETNNAMDNFRMTKCKLKIEEEECQAAPKH